MVSKVEDLVAMVNRSKVPLLERHQAFAELVDHFQGPGFRYAYAILGNTQLAQDVTQEAFLIAYQRLHQLRQPQLFSHWFTQIIRSQCRRVTRKSSLQTVPLDHVMALHTNGDDPSIQAEVVDLRAQVMAAVERLPLHEQTIVRLFYLKEFSVKEIANALDLPLTTVKKRLQTARERLRQSLCQLSFAIAFALNQVSPCLVYNVNPARQVRRVFRDQCWRVTKVTQSSVGEYTGEYRG